MLLEGLVVTTRDEELGLLGLRNTSFKVKVEAFYFELVETGGKSDSKRF